MKEKPTIIPLYTKKTAMHNKFNGGGEAAAGGGPRARVGARGRWYALLRAGVNISFEQWAIVRNKCCWDTFIMREYRTQLPSLRILLSYMAS